MCVLKNAMWHMIFYRYCRLYNIYRKITMDLDFLIKGIGLHIRESIP